MSLLTKPITKADISEKAIQRELTNLLEELKGFHHKIQTLREDSFWLPDNWRNSHQSMAVQCAKHLTQVHFQPDQDPKQTTLLPGVILVTEEFAREVAIIDAAKARFKKRMQFAKSELGRSPYLSLVKQVVHPRSISLLQLYRDFRVIYQPVTEVNFSWVFKETANVSLSPSSAVKHIIEQIENPKIQQDLLSQVANLGDVQFLYQRQIAPHLQANIKFENAKPIAKKVHSPIFLVQDAMPILPAGEMSIEPMPIVSGRAPRSDKKSWIRLYQGLNLFYAKK